jgi:outer membrane lipopolysaccharide assembly protein LptE/RlpB
MELTMKQLTLAVVMALLLTACGFNTKSGPLLCEQTTCNDANGNRWSDGQFHDSRGYDHQ